jgi:hypothetical protein
VSDNWYYADGDRQGGPVTLQALKKALASMDNPKHVLVWCGRFQDWKAAEEVPELNSVFPPPLPPRNERHDSSRDEVGQDLSYVSTILQPGEHILSVGRLHWIIYAEPAVAFALSIGCFFAAKFAALEPLFGEVSGLILLAASMLLFAKAWFDQWITEIAVKERGGSGLAAELVASAWPPQQVASKADAA